MIRVGLTGGIGSGKTIISKIFSVLDIPIFYSDNEAKNLLYNDQKILLALKTHFGDDVFTNHQPDKTKLASLIFSNPEKLKILNSIIHPAVQLRYLDWLKGHQSSGYTIKEAAILFESGANKNCDKIITVVAETELRIKRIMYRDKISRDQVLKRMKAQWDDHEKIIRSDYIIENNDDKLVIPQVIKIHEDLIHS